MFDIALVVSSGEHWEQQWSYLLSNFSPRTLYTIGELDPRVRPFSGHVAIQNAEEIPVELVVLAPYHGRYIKGTESLADFSHPTECCYLFGSDNVPLSEDQMGSRQPEHCIFIPTATKDDMYSFVAGAVTLWDRIRG